MSGKWIEWNGGAMPVSEDTRVDVRHRDGAEYECIRAGNLSDGFAVDWQHEEEEFDGDIVAYRICDGDAE